MAASLSSQSVVKSKSSINLLVSRATSLQGSRTVQIASNVSVTLVRQSSDIEVIENPLPAAEVGPKTLQVTSPRPRDQELTWSPKPNNLLTALTAVKVARYSFLTPYTTFAKTNTSRSLNHLIKIVERLKTFIETQLGLVLTKQNDEASVSTTRIAILKDNYRQVRVELTSI